VRVLFVVKDFIIEPLGIAYLSACLKDAGHEVSLVRPDVQDAVSYIKTWKPDVLAYSVVTGEHRYYQELNLELRKYTSALSIFGGPHCTFFPQFVMQEGVDYTVAGEGFDAIVEIVDSLSSNVNVLDIANLSWYDSDNLILHNNPLRPPVDVSQLPLPDRSIVYGAHKNKNNPIRSIMASWGCLMNCTYCYAPNYRDELGYPVRLRPVDSVMTEILELDSSYGFDLLYFQDDIFPLWEKEWVKEFCTRYGQEVHKPLHIQLRVEMVRPWVIPFFQKACVHGVTFAVESGDQELRRNILKRNVSDYKILEGAEMLRAAGFRLRVENVLGFPGDTLETALKTLDLNIACKPDLAWASLFQPYPGTPLGDESVALGLFTGDPADIEDNFFTSLKVSNPERREIENLQKLFSLAAYFPFIRKHLPLLVKQPPNALYSFVYKKWKQHIYDDRLFNTNLASKRD